MQKSYFLSKIRIPDLQGTTELHTDCRGPDYDLYNLCAWRLCNNKCDGLVCIMHDFLRKCIKISHFGSKSAWRMRDARCTNVLVHKDYTHATGSHQLGVFNYREHQPKGAQWPRLFIMCWWRMWDETLHPILMLFCKNRMNLALKSAILMQFHPIFGQNGCGVASHIGFSPAINTL